jgi:hypothetical protein
MMGLSLCNPKNVFPFLYPVVANPAMGKPLFKASEGGRIDILREWEDNTQSELEQGSET